MADSTLCKKMWGLISQDHKSYFTQPVESSTRPFQLSSS